MAVVKPTRPSAETPTPTGPVSRPMVSAAIRNRDQRIDGVGISPQRTTRREGLRPDYTGKPTGMRDFIASAVPSNRLQTLMAALQICNPIPSTQSRRTVSVLPLAPHSFRL